MKQQRKHIFDDPKNVTRIIRLLSTICAILFALDFILDRHESHPLDSIPGFYAFYGFIGCILLVIIAKWLRTVLMRPENYYDKETHHNKGRHNNVDP